MVFDSEIFDRGVFFTKLYDISFMTTNGRIMHTIVQCIHKIPRYLRFKWRPHETEAVQNWVLWTPWQHRIAYSTITDVWKAVFHNICHNSVIFPNFSRNYSYKKRENVLPFFAKTELRLLTRKRCHCRCQLWKEVQLKVSKLIKVGADINHKYVVWARWVGDTLGYRVYVCA